MNDVLREQAQVLPAPSYNGDATSTAALVLDGSALDKMLAAAEMMASARVTIPQHLRASTGDCMAVILQAMQWKMNPFAVAQKTHLSQSGQLGYEAQLINAVIASCGALQGQPEFEFLGAWEKILGRIAERQSDKGGKYYVAAWSRADEEGLGVVCSAPLRGEAAPRRVTVMLSQCWPRFSTQWTTDPQQQITYVAVRKFARRYAPGAILGVYTPEELDEVPPEKEINPLPRRAGATPPAAETGRSGSVLDAAQAQARENLIAELEIVAREAGVAAYAQAWAKLSKAQRKLVGAEEHTRLKALADRPVGSDTGTVAGEDDHGDRGD